MRIKEKANNSIWFGIIAVILIFVFQQIASKVGSFVSDLFDYSFVDQDNLFLRISVHHIIQMLLAMILIFIFSRKKELDFGLKPKQNKIGVKYLIIFSAVIMVYVIVSYLVGYKVNSIEPYSYQLNCRNVLGTLGFQLLLSGPSEELLFRALPITVLSWAFGKNNNHWAEIIIAAFLFSIAHISWNCAPFSLVFSWFQLFYAFVLGMIYGITYVKTNSVIYPMIMHSLSNVFMVGVGYIFAIVN